VVGLRLIPGPEVPPVQPVAPPVQPVPGPPTGEARPPAPPPAQPSPAPPPAEETLPPVEVEALRPAIPVSPEAQAVVPAPAQPAPAPTRAAPPVTLQPRAGEAAPASSGGTAPRRAGALALLVGGIALWRLAAMRPRPQVMPGGAVRRPLRRDPQLQ
jgi:outer membrane biosynthesis protein TonB